MTMMRKLLLLLRLCQFIGLIPFSLGYSILEIKEERTDVFQAFYTANCTHLNTGIQSFAAYNGTMIRDPAHVNGIALKNDVGDIVIKARGVYDKQYTTHTDGFYLNLNVIGSIKVHEDMNLGSNAYYGCGVDPINIIRTPTVMKLEIYLFYDFEVEREALTMIVSKETNQITYDRAFGSFLEFKSPYLPMSVNMIDLYNANFETYKKPISNVFDVCTMYNVIHMVIVGKVMVTSETNGLRTNRIYDVISGGKKNDTSVITKKQSCVDQPGNLNDAFFDCYTVTPSVFSVSGCEDLLREYGITTAIPSPIPSPLPSPEPLPSPSSSPELQPSPSPSPEISETPTKTQPQPQPQLQPDFNMSAWYHKNGTVVDSFPYYDVFVDNRVLIMIILLILCVIIIAGLCLLAQRVGLCVRCVKKEKHQMVVVPMGNYKKLDEEDASIISSSYQDLDATTSTQKRTNGAIVKLENVSLSQ